MSTLYQILDLLDDVRETANGWQARCPAHEDRHPSLSIAEGDGKLLLNCHAGCSIEQICRSLGLTPSDLFAEPTSANPPKPTRGSRIRKRRKDGGSPSGYPTRDEAVDAAARTAGGSVGGIWSYQDTKGRDAFSVVRIETAKGKTFRPVHNSDGTWRMGDPPGPLPLYRLPKFSGARRVYITVGAHSRRQ